MNLENIQENECICQGNWRNIIKKVEKYIKYWDNHYKTVYRWVLNKKEDIIDLLKDIEPYSIVKASQIKLLIRVFYEQPSAFPLIFEQLKEEKKHG